MDAVINPVKEECLQLLRTMDLPEIDGKSIEADIQPHKPVEIGDGTFSGVYRVRAVHDSDSCRLMENKGLLRLREDFGVDLAAVKSPHAYRVRDYMLSFITRKTPYEVKVRKVLKYYRRECTIWAKISTDLRQVEENNLLRFYGFLESYDFNKMPAFVSKFYALGDARNYIYRNIQPRMSNRQKIYLISDIAKALAFIHSTCGIAHRDVKGSNILLEAKQNRLIGVLGDFGSAKDFTFDEHWFSSSSEAGGDNWRPPEYKKPGGFHNDKGPGDIWSLGCTMLELLQEADPWHQVPSREISARLAAYEYPPKGEKVLQDHYDFIIVCWATEDNRPSAYDMHLRIEQFAEICNT